MKKKDKFLDGLFDEIISEGLQGIKRESGNIIEFVKEKVFNGEDLLYPTQKALLKAFYNLEMNQQELDILEEWKLDDRTTWKSGRKYKDLVFESGRGSGKSVLLSLISLYEFDEILTTPNVWAKYGLLPNSPIAIFLISQSHDQIKKTLFAMIRGYASNSDYFKGLIASGRVEIMEEEIRCRDRNLAIYATHTNSKALVGFSIKLLVLDEVARFEQDEFGNSKADEIWDNVGRGCDFEDNLIFTSQGSLTHRQLLTEVQEGKDISIFTMNPETYQVYETSDFHIWENPVRPLFTLTTKTGREYSYTDDHPFLVWKPNWLEPQWVELSDLKPGDKLAVLTDLNYQGHLRISKEKARLIGYLIGDGGITGQQVCFTNQTKFVVDDVQNILNKEWPGYKLINADKNRNYQYRINGLGNGNTHQLRLWLKSLGLMGTGCKTKFIPLEISSAADEIFAEFVKGLWATDGWVCSSKNRLDLSISLTAKEVIYSLSRELIRFNIHASVRTKINYHMSTTTPNGVTSYCLEIRDSKSVINFCQKIGWIPGKEEPQRQAYALALAKRKSRKGLNILPTGVINRIITLKNKLNISWSRLFNKSSYGSLNKQNSISKDLVKTLSLSDSLLSYITSSQVSWDEVSSVKPFKDGISIGIEIPSTHIIVNSIISHNCMRFGDEGRKIAISSAWEPGDKIEQLWDFSKRTPKVLGFRLKTWHINLNPEASEEKIKQSTEYTKDPIKGALEFEGIRTNRQGSYFVPQYVKASLQLESAIDYQPIPIDIHGSQSNRYYVGIKIDNLDISKSPIQSFLHVDYGIKKDAAALAVCKPFNKDGVWQIHVEILVQWKPYRDEKGRLRVVDFLNVDDAVQKICKARRVQVASYDSYQSQASIQKLHTYGIETKEMSTTRENQAKYYALTKKLIEQGTLLLPREGYTSVQAEVELCGIIQMPDGKITHGTTAKDLADAITNSVYNCYTYMIRNGLMLECGGISLLSIPNTSVARVKDNRMITTISSRQAIKSRRNMKNHKT